MNEEPINESTAKVIIALAMRLVGMVSIVLRFTIAKAIIIQEAMTPTMGMNTSFQVMLYCVVVLLVMNNTKET